jgi:hypothetical protein
MAPATTENHRTLPNFFIVGAPRSGTTSIWSYLRFHPDVYMSYQKEPLYFGSDLTKIPNEFFVLEKDAYLDLFRAGAGKKILGESSVMYLFSKKAAEEIYEFNPAARILVLLRNPVDMVYSHHGHLRWAGIEDLADFEEAYAAEADRRQGRRLPAAALMPQALYYSEVGLLAEQLERYLRIFPRNQIKVLFYEDLSRSAAQTYFSLLDFLELSRVAPPSYDTQNSHKEARSTALAAWIMRPPQAAKVFLDCLPGKYRHALLLRLQGLVNTRYVKREPLSRSMRQQLLEHFAADVRKLSALVDRDLSAWLGDEPKRAARA